METSKAAIPQEPSLWPENPEKVPGHAEAVTDARESGSSATNKPVADANPNGIGPSIPESEQPALEVEVLNVVESETLAPLHATLISTDKLSVKAQLAELEKEGLTLSNRMAIKVTDQASYDLACLTHQAAKGFLDRAAGVIEPLRAITWNIYQKVLGRKKGVLGAVENNLKPLADEILAFERKKKQEEYEAQQRLEKQRQKEEDDRRLALAESAKAAGMNDASVEEILTAPSTQPAAVAPPSFQRVAGTGSRENWAAEVEEGLDAQKALKKLVAAAAKKGGDHLLVYLEANMSKINGQAKIAKLAMVVPGFRAVDRGSLVNRK